MICEFIQKPVPMISKNALIDDDGVLFPAYGVTNRYPILRLVVGTSVANRDGGFVLFVHMFTQGISCVAVAECRSHIFAHKEGLTLLVRHGSDIAEHVVVEYL